MRRIKNLLILEHFTNGIGVEVDTFGKYWFEFNGSNVLVLRHNEEFVTVSNYLGESIMNCIGRINEDVIDELKKCIEEYLRVKELKNS